MALSIDGTDLSSSTKLDPTTTQVCRYTRHKHIIINLCWRAMTSHNCKCTVKPVLSGHYSEESNVQSNLYYQGTAVKNQIYSQTCIIRALQWRIKCTVKPVLSGHCSEESNVQSNLSYQGTRVKNQMYSQTCPIEALQWENKLYSHTCLIKVAKLYSQTCLMPPQWNAKL